MVEVSAWPSIADTSVIGRPSATRSEAAAWRRSYKRNCAGKLAAARWRLNSRVRLRASSAVLIEEVKTNRFPAIASRYAFARTPAGRCESSVQGEDDPYLNLYAGSLGSDRRVAWEHS